MMNVDYHEAGDRLIRYFLELFNMDYMEDQYGKEK